MAKEKKTGKSQVAAAKASAKEALETQRALERAGSEKRPWLYKSAPWEEYYGGVSMAVAEPPAMTLQESDAFAKGGGNSITIFSAEPLGDIVLDDQVKLQSMAQSYRMYREDPYYRCAVNNLVNFIIGKGIKFHAADEDPKVQAYLDAFWRENKMDGRDAEIVRRWILTGEISLRWYTKGKVGEGEMPAKMLSLRFIPFWRISAVKKNAEDAEVITGFKVMKASRPTEPSTMGEDDDVEAQEMLFWKNSTPEEDRGEPPLLVVMRGCKWYADWLLNRVVLNRNRTAYVLFKKVIGATPGKVSSVSSNDPDGDRSGAGGKLEKRLPKFGTVVAHSDKIEYDFKSPNLDATDASNDGKAIRQYVCAGAQLPEFMLGDISSANLASTMVAENPFIRQIEAYQDFFENVFQAIFQAVIKHGQEVGSIPKQSRETTVLEGRAWARPLRRLACKLGLAEATDDGKAVSRKEIPTKTDVIIDWPNLLHKDQLQEAQAFQIDQGMGLVSRETLRAKRGYDHDVEEERLAREGEMDADAYDRQRQGEIDDEEDEEEDGDEGGEKKPKATKPGFAPGGKPPRPEAR